MADARKTNHTPGPWSMGSAPLTDVAWSPRVYAGYDGVAQVPSGPCAEADARLIAAAPDLLAALKHLMRYDFGNSDGAKEARAAIEKATGEKLPSLPEGA